MAPVDPSIHSSSPFALPLPLLRDGVDVLRLLYLDANV